MPKRNRTKVMTRCGGWLFLSHSSQLGILIFRRFIGEWDQCQLTIWQISQASTLLFLNSMREQSHSKVRSSSPRGFSCFSVNKKIKFLCLPINNKNLALILISLSLSLSLSLNIIYLPSKWRKNKKPKPTASTGGEGKMANNL